MEGERRRVCSVTLAVGRLVEDLRLRVQRCVGHGYRSRVRVPLVRCVAAVLQGESLSRAHQI